MQVQMLVKAHGVVRASGGRAIIVDSIYYEDRTISLRTLCSLREVCNVSRSDSAFSHWETLWLSSRACQIVFLFRLGIVPSFA